jgi:rhodanese-related sulfurtransferase
MSEQIYPQPIAEIDVEELAIILAESNLSLQLIDVRERYEVEIAYLENFEVLPLSESEQWAGEIKTRFNPDVETIVMCHHGVRSAQMCQWLLNIGFTKVKNVSGGIDAYSVLIDPHLPRY